MRVATFLDSPEFRKEVLQGIKELASIVQMTLGPGGRPILIEQENGSVVSSKDGVTVAQHFAANTAVKKLVAQAAIEASTRTVRSCGDGTTTSIVLAAAITEAGQNWLEKNPGYSPQRLARDLKDLFNATIKPAIEALSRPIKDLPLEESKKAIFHVAMVSANFDENIATSVAQAIEQSGDLGMVIVEEGAGGLETTVEHKQGFPVNSGLSDLGGAASAAFVNRKNYGDTVLSGAWVALYDGEITEISTVLPLLERVTGLVDEMGNPQIHPLVLIAHGFGDQVLKVLAQNFKQQRVIVVPMITPRTGQSLGRQGFLNDMAAYVGGTVFDSVGTPLQSATPSTIGFVEEVKISRNESVFITSPEEEAVDQRTKDLQSQMEGASEFDKDKLRYRIGALTGGVATIYAGGATALEAKERRDRIVDAVSSVRSSLDLGIVPGGGSTLLHISRALLQVGPSQILAQALTKPFIQILLNAGVASNEPEAMFIGNQAGDRNGTFYVYDALKRESVEFWESGIFDPAKVTISALQNALSVAQLLMTTGGAIAKQMSDGEVQAKAMQEGLIKAINNGELE